MIQPYIWFPIDGNATVPQREVLEEPQPPSADAHDPTADGHPTAPSPPLPTTEAAQTSTPTTSAQAAPAEAHISQFTVDVRQALRLVLYSSLRDEALRDVLDGCLLPPPLALPDLGDTDRLFTRSEVVEAAARIPAPLHKTVVTIPLNFALTTGVYDARLRVAMRRLAHLLGFPFAAVRDKEEMLAAVDVSDLAALDAKAQKNVVDAKKNKVPVKKIAAIGAVSILGAAALIFTGGLAAPIIAPAFLAVIAATTTTLGTVGAIGGALLGGTALATIFIAVVGVATHAAALAALLAPVLTAVNLTAIFGVGGAGLAGYKAKRRLGGLDEFLIRSIGEVERHAPLAVVGADVGEDDMAAVAQESRRVGGGKSMEDDVNAGTLQGMLVPLHVRSVALVNLAASNRFKSRRRVVVCGIENRLPEELELTLVAAKLFSGVWGNLPPRSIPADTAGLFVAHNRSNYPTGAGGYVCFRVRPSDKALKGGAALSSHQRAAVGLCVWLRVEVSFMGATSVACMVLAEEHCPIGSAAPHRTSSFRQPAQESSRAALLSGGPPAVAPDAVDTERLLGLVSALDHAAATKPFVAGRGELEVDVQLSPKPHLIVRLLPPVGTDDSGRALREYFHSREVPQQLVDAYQRLKKARRHVSVVIRNSISAQDDAGRGCLEVLSVTTTSGGLLKAYVPPTVIPQQHAALIPVLNKDVIPAAAEVIVLLRGRRREEKTASPDGEGQSVPAADSRYFYVELRGRVSSAMNTSSGGVRVSGEKPNSNNSSQAATAAAPSDDNDRPDTDAPSPPRWTMYEDPAEACGESPYARVAITFDSKYKMVLFDVLDPRPACSHAIANVDGASAEAVASAGSRRAMTLTVAATGYITLFDPRVLARDQQVAVWQPVLGTSPHFSRSEAFVVQWDNDEQSRFFAVVGVDTESAAVKFTVKQAKKTVKSQAKKRFMQGALFAAFHGAHAFVGTFDLPMYAVWASRIIDNSFATLRNRAKAAGRELASALLSDLRGNRPVTLTGFSFGANVIFECLLMLQEANALAVVEDVVLLGACLEIELGQWRRARMAVAGRLVNVYNRHDWILWAYHRVNSLDHRPMAGMAQVPLPGVENIDSSAVVSAHGEYALRLPEVMALVPEEPTEESCRYDTSGAATGALVPAADMLNAADRVMSAMLSPISLSHAFVVSITNRLTVDIDSGPLLAALDDTLTQEETQTKSAGAFRTSECPMVFIGDVCYAAHFDFCPPPLINSGQSGVGGVVVPRGSAKPCAVFAYAADMQPLSGSLLVVLVFVAFDTAGKAVRGGCKALVVPAAADADEDVVSLGRRLRSVVEHYGGDPDAVSCFAAASGSTQTTAEVPIEAAAGTDAGTCPVRVAWTWRDQHFTVAVTGVLSRDTPLQEEDEADEEQDHSELLDPACRAAMAFDTPFAALTTYLDADAAGSCAPLVPIDQMHSGMTALREALCDPYAGEGDAPHPLAEGSAVAEGSEGPAVRPTARSPLRWIKHHLADAKDTKAPAGSDASGGDEGNGPEGRERLTADLVDACHRTVGFATRAPKPPHPNGSGSLRLEATMQALHGRTVAVVQPLVIANCSGNGTPLVFPEDSIEGLTTGDNVTWLRIPPPEVPARQCALLAFVWRADPCAIFRTEAANHRLRNPGVASPLHKTQVLLATFAMVDGAGAGATTYIVRILATIEAAETYAEDRQVRTTFSLSCLVDTPDEGHRSSVAAGGQVLRGCRSTDSYRDDLLRFLTVFVPAGGAARDTAEAATSAAAIASWSLF